jgi:hypothetical protein
VSVAVGARVGTGSDGFERVVSQSAYAYNGRVSTNPCKFCKKTLRRFKIVGIKC